MKEQIKKRVKDPELIALATQMVLEDLKLKTDEVADTRALIWQYAIATALLRNTGFNTKLPAGEHDTDAIRDITRLLNIGPEIRQEALKMAGLLLDTILLALNLPSSTGDRVVALLGYLGTRQGIL